MKTKQILLSSCLILSTALASAQIAADNASNYVNWTNGSNGGSGFLSWSFGSNNDDGPLFAGSFLGDSTAGAGNINTGGQSFGLYANPGGAFMIADRAFADALTVGQVFSLDLALNFDNGNKGFSLFAGTMGEVFNFNVGGGGSVSSAYALLLPGSGAGYNYGGNDAVLSLSFSMATSSTFEYEVSRQSGMGSQGVLFSGTVTGLTEAPSGFRLYVSGTDGGGAAQNNLYANSLQIIPEPGTALLLLGGLGLLALLKRARH